jgi:hypothetical protein
VKHLHFDCFIGISGDMTLAALIDLGVDAGELVSALSGLGHHIGIEPSTVSKSGIEATAVTVSAGDHSGHEHHGETHGFHEGHDQGDDHDHHHHGLSYTECREAVLAAGLPERAMERSLSILRCIGESEAHVHGSTLDAVHFHELGGVDTLIDVCGTAVALEMLGVESISAAPIPLSSGFVKCAHGNMPVPPPAVAKMVEGLPVRPVDVSGETVTPTGAAIIKGLADPIGEMPAMTVERISHGAGGRDLDPYPNLLRLFLGTTSSYASLPRVTELTTQIDDSTPEIISHAAQRLMAAGALDVYLSPVTMKKGRSGVAITVVTAPAMAEEMGNLLMRETSTIGLRVQECRRMCLPREISQVETPFGGVEVKWVTLPDGSRRASPEYDDCARVADAKGVPLREVYETVVAALRSG